VTDARHVLARPLGRAAAVASLATALGCGSDPASQQPAEGVREVFVIPQREARPTDRIVRLDASLAQSGSIDLGGADAYGALSADGRQALVVVPLAPDGTKTPSLVAYDAESLAPRRIGDVAPDDAIAPYKSRPLEPFYVGADVPDLVVLPLRRVHPTSTTTFDVTLRVVDVAKGTWTDVAGPDDAGRGALYKTRDGAPHAAIVGGRHELFDVDLARGAVRRVTKAPFLAAGRVPGETPLALTGFAVVADEGFALAVNYDGQAVRIALADGDVRPVALPVAGLGKDAFACGLAWSAASKRFAVTVLRPGDPQNFPSHVVFLDGALAATGIEISLPSGATQTLFSPRGDELVVCLFDGAVRRHRVSDGALLAASAPGLGADALLGAR